jgi:hypothetical protein
MSLLALPAELLYLCLESLVHSETESAALRPCIWNDRCKNETCIGERTKSRHSVALTCKTLNSAVTPLLYRDVDLTHSQDTPFIYASWLPVRAQRFHRSVIANPALKLLVRGLSIPRRELDSTGSRSSTDTDAILPSPSEFLNLKRLAIVQTEFLSESSPLVVSMFPGTFTFVRELELHYAPFESLARALEATCNLRCLRLLGSRRFEDNNKGLPPVVSHMRLWTIAFRRPPWAT